MYTDIHSRVKKQCKQVFPFICCLMADKFELFRALAYEHRKLSTSCTNIYIFIEYIYYHPDSIQRKERDRLSSINMAAHIHAHDKS